MARYGQSPGGPTATRLGATPGYVVGSGWTPTLSPLNAALPGTVVHVSASQVTPYDRQLSKLLNRRSTAFLKAAFTQCINSGALNGFGMGVTYYRVPGVQALTDPSQLGGLITPETGVLVSRSLTATDTSDVLASINQTMRQSLSNTSGYVADASGNGGGGHAGF